MIAGLAFVQLEGYGKQLSALAAEPLTPEATSYQVDRTDAVQVKNKVDTSVEPVTENRSFYK